MASTEASYKEQCVYAKVIEWWSKIRGTKTWCDSFDSWYVGHNL